MEASPKTAASEPQQFLTCSLDGAALGMSILRIIEIIELGDLTPVPMMPSFIRGVLNLRGAVVPVVDLKARFGRGPASPTRKTCVVIVELRSKADDSRQKIGVMVDQVNAVVEIRSDAIESAPAFGTGVREDFISGMGRLDDRFVPLLDLDNLLCVDDMAEVAVAALESAPADAPGEADESEGEEAGHPGALA